MDGQLKRGLIPRESRLFAKDRSVKRITDLPEHTLRIRRLVISRIRSGQSNAGQCDFANLIAEETSLKKTLAALATTSSEPTTPIR